MTDETLNQKAVNGTLTDKERLDYLQKLLDKADYTGKCILRESGLGRGFRLHETTRQTAVSDVRQAIDDYIAITESNW